MARPKSLSDDDLLDRLLATMRRTGPDRLSFAAAAAGAGLSGPTLVQRFGTRDAMLKAVLRRAWDLLDAKTEQEIARMPRTPAGAVALLVALSGDYDSLQDYSEGLLVLREDMRSSELRARGDRWGAELAEASSRALGGEAPSRPELGRLMASVWQGALLWWGFSRRGTPADAVRLELAAFCRALGYRWEEVEEPAQSR